MKRIPIDDLAAEIMQGLTEYSEIAEQEMEKAVRKTARSVKAEIMTNAPKNSGEYAADWRVSQVEKNSHKLKLVVHSPKHYSRVHLLEKGHAKRNGGRVAAIPHVAPAEQHGEELLEELIEKALR